VQCLKIENLFAGGLKTGIKARLTEPFPSLCRIFGKGQQKKVYFGQWH